LVLLRPAGRTALAPFGDHRVGDVALGQTLERGLRVVAAVELERLDLLEEIHSVRVVEGRCEHHRVVAVCTVDGDGDGDALAVREDGPLPAELAPIGRAGASSLTATRALVQRAVDGDVVEAESDDLVVRRDRLRLAITGITNALSVTSGSFGYCAVLSTGGVDCWGYGATGQLGNGKSTSSNVPVAVTGITNALSVTSAYGGSGSCAVLSTGGVDCWGYGGFGQLGDGTTASSNVPIAVTGIGPG